MLFRNSFISHTKKLFQRSIESFKSFLSNGYTKLPKSSPPCHCTFNPFSCTRGGGGSDLKFSHSYRELDSFYAEYTNNQRHDADQNKETATTINNVDRNGDINAHISSTTPTTKALSRVENQDSIVSSTNETLFRERRNRKGGKGKGKEQERVSLVGEKLRELEMMDVGNVEHVLDIEEVMYYYSRLTCPAYRGIVDKFFAEMYTEFSSMQAAAAAAALGGINVRRRRPVRRPRSLKV